MPRWYACMQVWKTHHITYHDRHDVDRCCCRRLLICSNPSYCSDSSDMKKNFHSFFFRVIGYVEIFFSLFVCVCWKICASNFCLDSLTFDQLWWWLWWWPMFSDVRSTDILNIFTVVWSVIVWERTSHFVFFSEKYQKFIIIGFIK